MKKIEHAAGWADGWTPTGRRKLARFERLALRGARMRRLKRAVVPHEVCLNAMAERARIATPKKGWQPWRAGKRKLSSVERARRILSRSIFVNDSIPQRELLNRLPAVEVSLIRFFVTMGKRISRMRRGEE
jgi:hypothetical protein